MDDFVDGMNLEEEWGEINLEFDKLLLFEYIWEKNDMIVCFLLEDMCDVILFVLLSERMRLVWDVWWCSVSMKYWRINDELLRYRYLMRFWKVGLKDLCENIDWEV